MLHTKHGARMTHSGMPYSALVSESIHESTFYQQVDEFMVYQPEAEITYDVNVSFVTKSDVSNVFTCLWQVPVAVNTLCCFLKFYVS